MPLRAETGTTSAKSARPAAAWRAAATLAREAASILLTTHSLGVSTLASSAARKRSPAPTPAAASTSWRTRSTSDRVPRTRSFSRWPSRVRGLWRPGVSTSTIWPSGRCSTPRTAERVVCGLSETIASFWPSRALSRVDLPTLGRPTSATSPDFIGGPPARSSRREQRPQGGGDQRVAGLAGAQHLQVGAPGELAQDLAAGPAGGDRVGAVAGDGDGQEARATRRPRPPPPPTARRRWPGRSWRSRRWRR